MNANEDTHAIFNQSNGIELTLVSPPTKGFRRSGVVDIDDKTRVQRGQNGMVDAGANGLD